MSSEVAVNLPLENASYSPRPPHSPAISPAKNHYQASNNQVSSQTNCWITLSAFHSISKSAASMLSWVFLLMWCLFQFLFSEDRETVITYLGTVKRELPQGASSSLFFLMAP